MTTRSAAGAILGACATACIAASACRPADASKARGDSAELEKREARLERSLAKRDSGAISDSDATKPVARWIMPPPRRRAMSEPPGGAGAPARPAAAIDHGGCASERSPA